MQISLFSENSVKIMKNIYTEKQIILKLFIVSQFENDKKEPKSRKYNSSSLLKNFQDVNNPISESKTDQIVINQLDNKPESLNFHTFKKKSYYRYSSKNLFQTNLNWSEVFSSF